MLMGALTPNVGVFRETDKDKRGGEDINRAIKYLFADGNKRRSLVVAYENDTKWVGNVENDIYRPDNPSSRIE